MNNNIPSSQDIMRQVEVLKKRFEATAECIGLSAKLLRVSYEALVKEGFTDDQAIKIINVRGPYLQ